MLENMKKSLEVRDLKRFESPMERRGKGLPIFRFLVYILTILNFALTPFFGGS